MIYKKVVLIFSRFGKLDMTVTGLETSDVRKIFHPMCSGAKNIFPNIAIMIFLTDRIDTASDFRPRLEQLIKNFDPPFDEMWFPNH